MNEERLMPLLERTHVRTDRQSVYKQEAAPQSIIFLVHTYRTWLNDASAGKLGT